MTWIDNFYQVISKKFEIKAFYFEMNEFDINTDTWYIDGFSYGKDGGLDLDDMDWLSDFTRDRMASTKFILTGFEKLQNAFKNSRLKPATITKLKGWCEQIVIAKVYGTNCGRPI